MLKDMKDGKYGLVGRIKAIDWESPLKKIIKNSKPVDAPPMFRHSRPQEPDCNGWIVIGRNERDCPIQYNVNTNEVRILTEWCEIFKTEITSE